MQHRTTKTTRLRQVLTVLIAGVLVFAALQAPAGAATTRSVSITSKATGALANKALTVSGVLTKSPKGSAVVIQRKAGGKWVTAKATSTTTGGKYTARITMPSKVGTYTFRAVAPAKGNLRAATSSQIRLSALRPAVATMNRAVPAPTTLVNAGANVVISGSVKPFVTNTVVTIQRFGKSSWVGTGVTAKVTNKGTFSTPVRVKDSSVFRVFVPRAGLNASTVSSVRAVSANPTIATSRLPDGLVGVPYVGQVAQVGTNPGTWKVAPALPAGLSLNAKTGRITGTPNATFDGNRTFRFEQVGRTTAVKSVALSITNPTPPVISTTSLPAGIVNVAYAFQLNAQGNPTGTWTAAPLPAGLTLNPGTGVISGTPTSTGTTQVTIGFTQANTDLSAPGKTLPLQITPPPPPPVISTAALTPGTINVAYAFQLAAVDNPIGLWSATPLPAGLTLNASTGVISGTPTATGTTQVTIGFTQTNSGLAALSKTLDLVIHPPAPVIETTALPNGQSGILFQAYSFTLTAVGNPPGTWNVTGLPDSYSFNASTGEITAPFLSVTTKGEYELTINFTATGNPNPATPVQLILVID